MIKRIIDYRCHPFIFGLYRLTMGFTLTLYMLLLSNRWIEFFGPYGTSPIKLRDDFELYRPSLLSYIHTENGLWLFYGLTLIMLGAFTLGRLGKLPALFLLLTMISIENSTANNVNAEEFALCVFAFYALIMPINSALVLDFKTRRFINRPGLVPGWTLIPFFVHIEIIYTFSLPLKPYFDSAWTDGTLIYYAVNVFDMARFPGGKFFGVEIFKIGHAVVSRFFTWSSLIVEAAFPILVWTKRFRVPVILAMAAFQIGIAIFLSGVQFFSLCMLNALILFLPSEKTYRFCSRFWRRITGAR